MMSAQLIKSKKKELMNTVNKCLVGYTSYKTLPYVSNFQPWPWRIIVGFFPKYINKAFI